MQQQLLQQQQLLLSQQARSQEMLATPHQQARSQEMLASPHRPQALGADALYQQYGPPGRRSALYQRDLDVRSMANFTSLKTGPQSQVSLQKPSYTIKNFVDEIHQVLNFLKLGLPVSVK